MKKIILLLIFGLFWLCNGYQTRDLKDPNVHIQYKYWKYWHNLNKVPDWKLKIYKEKKVDRQTMLMIMAINNKECGNIYWYCWYKPTNDWGNFGWNDKNKHPIIKEFIKKDEYKKLFAQELDRMLLRIEEKKKRSGCRWAKDEKLIFCIAKYHNGWNNQGASYARWAVVIYNLYSKYY